MFFCRHINPKTNIVKYLWCIKGESKSLKTIKEIFWGLFSFRDTENALQKQAKYCNVGVSVIYNVFYRFAVCFVFSWVDCIKCRTWSPDVFATERPARSSRTMLEKNKEKNIRANDARIFQMERTWWWMWIWHGFGFAYSQVEFKLRWNVIVSWI